MSQTRFLDLSTEVLPYLAADPSDPVTENAIRRAAAEFCANTWIWKHTPDPVDVEAGEAVYDLDLPAETTLVTILSVELDGRTLTSCSVDWLNRNTPDWRTRSAPPDGYTQLDASQIVLSSVPTQQQPAGLSMTLVLQPAHDAHTCPQWLARQYGHVFAEGALARLMQMPNKPWVDVPNGMARRARFEANMAHAKAYAVAGLGRAVLRSKPHY